MLNCNIFSNSIFFLWSQKKRKHFYSTFLLFDTTKHFIFIWYFFLFQLQGAWASDVGGHHGDADIQRPGLRRGKGWGGHDVWQVRLENIILGWTPFFPACRPPSTGRSSPWPAWATETSTRSPGSANSWDQVGKMPSCLPVLLINTGEFVTIF